jgi:hypothetical protein
MSAACPRAARILRVISVAEAKPASSQRGKLGEHGVGPAGSAQVVTGGKLAQRLILGRVTRDLAPARGLAANTWMASAPIAAAYRSPPVASPLAVSTRAYRPGQLRTHVPGRAG